MNVYQFKIDYECNQEEFWEWAQKSKNKLVRKLLVKDSFILLSTEGETLLNLIKSAPGWDGNSSYAPNPICVDCVDIDDQVGLEEYNKTCELIREIRELREYEMNDDDHIQVYRPVDEEFWAGRTGIITDAKLLIKVEGESIFLSRAPSLAEIELCFPDVDIIGTGKGT